MKRASFGATSPSRPSGGGDRAHDRTHGRLDIVVHNASPRRAHLAGTGGRSRCHHRPDRDVDHCVYLFARAVHPHLVANRGTLILLTSPAGMEGSGNLPVYATVKGAQRGLLKSLARMGTRRHPGQRDRPVPGRRHDHRHPGQPDPAGPLEARTPLAYRRSRNRHRPSPSSCFDMARHMTGQTMAVDGGRYLGL